MSYKEDRLEKANDLLQAIASCGRRFFFHSDDGAVSRLELDHRGRVWLIDHYSKRRVYTHDERSKWRGFTNGGTLRALICDLRDFVVRGELLHPGVLGFGRDNHWAYGGDLAIVQDAAIRLGLVDLSLTQPGCPHQPPCERR